VRKHYFQAEQNVHCQSYRRRIYNHNTRETSKYRPSEAWFTNYNLLNITASAENVHLEFSCKHCRRQNFGTLLMFRHVWQTDCLQGFLKKISSRAVAIFETADSDLLMVHADSAAPYFLPAFWEFSNKVFAKLWIGKGRPTAWPSPYSDLISLQFCLRGHIKSTFLRYRSLWCPGHATLNIESIHDDSFDTCNFPASQAVTVQASSVLRGSSAWTLWAFSLKVREP